MTIALPAPEKYNEPKIVFWTEWTRCLKNFTSASSINNDNMKKATLLHLARFKINNKLDTQSKEGDSDTFDEAITKNTEYLNHGPWVNFIKFKAYLSASLWP